MSTLLAKAMIKVLTDALASDPPPPPFDQMDPKQIRLGMIQDEAEPKLPGIFVDNQGGGTWGIVGGMDEPMMLVQCWHRGLKSDAMLLYDWVSAHLHTRRLEVTAAMQTFPPGGKCGRIYRIFRVWLWDQDLRAHYVTARYACKIIDYSDLYREFGQAAVS